MDIVEEVAALQRMTVGQLRQKYAEVFGEPTRSGHREFLVRKIAWRLQAQEEGGLSERARRRALELANDLDLRTRAPNRAFAPAGGQERAEAAPLPDVTEPRLPMPGTVLKRAYKGRDILVTVLPQGFQYDGQVYRSLSAIAQVITGTHWNGFHFFGLAKGRRGA